MQRANLNFCRLVFLSLFFCLAFASVAAAQDDYGSFGASSSGGGGAMSNPRTVGGTIFGSIQLVDTTPVLDPGIGGGFFFDYRFNERFSVALEAFAVTQDGDGRSRGEGDIEFLGIPTATLKLYFLNGTGKFDPYAGIGVGFYALTEGGISDQSFGVGLGAQVETGLDYLLTDTLLLSVGGTYRSVGLINSLSGAANATTYMPYTLFGRIGYKF